MATNFPVKYCHTGMRGAPQIPNQPGALLAALRAFLITGFGSVTAQSVEVNNGVATAVLGSGNSFEEYAVILIVGADDAALNGEARVATATSSSITWSTTAEDGTKTGLIEIRYAPVGGWEEPFAGTTEKAVFRSTNAQANGHFLWIDDSQTDIAQVAGYENMTDLDTGSGKFAPNVNSIWMRNGATGLNWYFIADDRMLLVCNVYKSWSNITGANIRGFGDPLALSPSGDAWGTVLSAEYYECGAFSMNYNTIKERQYVYSPRAVSGIGGCVQSVMRPLVCKENYISGRDVLLGDFPSSVDGQLKYSRCFLTVGPNDATPRSILPGILHIPQNGVNQYLQHGDTVVGSGEMAGRILLGLNNFLDASKIASISLVDITGPWR